MPHPLLTQWQTEGYIVVRGLFDPARAQRLLGICDETLRRWRECDPQGLRRKVEREPHEMRHLNHPAYREGRPHADFEAIMDAIADPRLLDTIRTILGEPPLFRCTSYYYNPQHKSQDGNWHRDSQFMWPDESEERKRLIDQATNDDGVQMQIALVRSDDVEYVPRSHLRWDTPEEYAIRRADGAKNWCSNNMPGALRIALNPGDAAIFNAMGLHRGRYHTDKLRRTIMLTYTRSSKPCEDYFSKQPWFLEPGYLENLKPATQAFFAPFVETYREFWMKDALQPQA
jgi:hypothetical protein